VSDRLQIHIGADRDVEELEQFAERFIPEPLIYLLVTDWAGVGRSQRAWRSSTDSLCWSFGTALLFEIHITA
jgi:hypothetical protein